jgi:hypothetical protein
MKGILKKIKPTIIENYVYESKYSGSLPYLELPANYALKIYQNSQIAGINIIDRNKRPDNICYALFENSNLVHISWVYKRNLLLRQLGYDGRYYAVASFTYPLYRGKGLYPVILNKILSDYNEKKILGFVDIHNEGSIRAFKKAGFKQCYHFKLIRLFGLKIFLKKYGDQY